MLFLRALNFVHLRNIASPSLNLARCYAYKSDLKVRWIRPKKIPCILPIKSGDLSDFSYPDQKGFMKHFDKSEELKTADDLVKNMFTLEQNRRAASVRIVEKEAVDSVKRHEHDWGSYEVRIARMTAKIRSMQDYMALNSKNKKNKKEKVKLKEMIDKRKKFLRFLRRWDYKKFEWLLEKLDIIYRPYPEKFHAIARKESIRKLCTIHCDDVRQQRLDAYKKELQSKQIAFLEEKIKNLEFIRKEQEECRVPITVPSDQIKAVKKQLEELRSQREEEEKVTKLQSEKDDYELNL